MTDGLKLVDKSASSVEELMSMTCPPLKWWEKIYYGGRRRVVDTHYWFQCLYQKMTDGFAHHEAWNFNSWHADLVTPRLKYLRASIHGCPMDMTEDEWREALDKIIFAFENFNKDPDFEYVDGKINFAPIDAQKAKIQDGLNLFSKHYNNLWD